MGVCFSSKFNQNDYQSPSHYQQPSPKDFMNDTSNSQQFEIIINKENDRFDNLTEDLIVLIADFAVYKYPNSLTRLTMINKHWYRCLNPNKMNVNMIWENNICRVQFEYIPKKLKIRRWDRYFQYKCYKIKEFTDYRINSDNWNLLSHQVVEGCDHDTSAINQYYDSSHFSNKTIEKNDIDEINGLPKGFEWKLKCPVVGILLEPRSDNKSYCNVCKKNVFHVSNVQELKEKANNGKCVQLV
eukprot:230033_1